MKIAGDGLFYCNSFVLNPIGHLGMATADERWKSGRGVFFFLWVFSKNF